MNSEPPGIFANSQALQHALADRELVGASGIPAPVKAGADKTLAKKAPPEATWPGLVTVPGAPQLTTRFLP